jgi:hypothetical protein
MFLSLTFCSGGKERGREEGEGSGIQSFSSRITFVQEAKKKMEQAKAAERKGIVTSPGRDVRTQRIRCHTFFLFCVHVVRLIPCQSSDGEKNKSSFMALKKVTSRFHQGSSSGTPSRSGSFAVPEGETRAYSQLVSSASPVHFTVTQQVHQTPPRPARAQCPRSPHSNAPSPRTISKSAITCTSSAISAH